MADYLGLEEYYEARHRAHRSSSIGYFIRSECKRTHRCLLTIGLPGSAPGWVAPTLLDLGTMKRAKAGASSPATWRRALAPQHHTLGQGRRPLATPPRRKA
ncbi:hypothetical protein E2562_033550 [Oryza meyeriana var. granulata]|uniref:Uncharacterized protein n=1 Tax=Oryza meyeriana var. granulata TaxID=110450 RepID=A0A6G1ES69_9ORYZ|nr:hypothetical protein E2562_033550 [Oryza meyeriana var. granulata]